MLALIAHPQAHGEVFNIGHTKEISIYDLAVLVKQIAGSASEIVLVPDEQVYEAGFGDMVRRTSRRSRDVGTNEMGCCWLLSSMLTCWAVRPWGRPG